MKFKPHHHIVLLAVAAALLSSASVRAGTDSPLDANLSLNYQAPGARSKAIGGAFIGLADDATAATVNPAGLIQLSKPEAAAEFYSGSTGLETANYQGSLEYSQGVGYAMPTEVRNDITSFRSFGSTAGLDYVSYVLPQSHVVFAFSASKPVDFNLNGLTNGQVYTDHWYTDCMDCYCLDGNGNFSNRCQTPFGGSMRVDTNVNEQPQTYSGHLRENQFNAAVAFSLGKKFSLGLTLSYGDFKGHLTSQYYLAANRGIPGNHFYDIDQETSDHDIGGTLGFLWRANDKFQMGANYRKGLKYESRVTVTPYNASGKVVADSFTESSRTPDQFGLGFVYRPNPVFVISLEIDRVRYSQLLGGLHTFRQDEIDHFLDGSSLHVEDATEPHLGFEYVAIVGGAPAVFRFGGWQEHAHRFRYQDGGTTFIDRNPITIVNPSGNTSVPTAAQLDAVYNENAQRAFAHRFPGGENQIHYSAGIGMVLAQKVQLDMGYDFSRLSKQFVISGIYRFGLK